MIHAEGFGTEVGIQFTYEVRVEERRHVEKLVIAELAVGIVGDAIQLLALDAHRREAVPDLDVGLRDAYAECLGSNLGV